MTTRVLSTAVLVTMLVSCASTSGDRSASANRHREACLEEVEAKASGAPTIALLADAVGVRSERRVDQDAMRVVIRAPRHVSSGAADGPISARRAAMSQLLRGELTVVLAERWKLIDDPAASSPTVTHELQADFGEVHGDVALSIRLIDTDSSWVVATARSVVPMDEMPFLAALPDEGVEPPVGPLEPAPQELAEPALPVPPGDSSPQESGVLVEQLAGQPLLENESLTSQVITDGQLQELVGPAARRLGSMKRIDPR